MGLGTTIQTFLDALKTVEVTTQDGSTSTLTAMVFNGQPERKQEGGGYLYQTPAVFIQPKLSEGTIIGGGANQYELEWTLLVEQEMYNNESVFDESANVWLLRDKIHRVCNMLKLPMCSQLISNSNDLDVNHGSSHFVTLNYRCSYTDLTGTAYDELYEAVQEVTLEGATVGLAPDYNKEIAELSNDIYTATYIEVFDDISISSSGESLTVTINKATLVVPDESTPEYVIDWGDGDAESIYVGVAAIHSYSKLSSKVTVIISGMMGASVYFDIETDESGDVIAYPTRITNKLDYDLDSVIDPVYVAFVNASVSYSNMTFTSFTVFDMFASSLVAYYRELSDYNAKSTLALSENYFISDLVTRTTNFSGVHITSTSVIILGTV